MNAFTLDTSGAVESAFDDGTPQVRLYWTDLSPFAQGYVEALFGSVGAEDGEPGSFASDSAYALDGRVRVGFSDLHPEALAAIRKDCVRLRAFFAGDPGAHEGAEAWRYRQTGQLLQFPMAASVAQPLTPYLDDTGKVRLRESGQ